MRILISFYYAEKTVENTLKMCKVVSLAKEDMKAVEYSKFCKEIGLKEESSTVRKYLAIGQRYDQFIEYADRLPNSWTSLYSITQIPAEKFVELIEGATTFSDFTANDLKQLLNEGSIESPKKKIKVVISLQLLLLKFILSEFHQPLIGIR